MSSVPVPTTGEANSCTRLLQASKLPRHEARRLMSLASGRSLTWLIAHADEAVPAGVAARFETLAARRLAGEPLAYLLGEQEFYGRHFAVSPAVLIPRADTEALVEVALARLAELRAARADESPARPLRGLDLGTGSGILAVTLALEAPDIEMHAVDLSEAALAVARNNASRLGARIHGHAGSWWAALEPAAERRFSLIVSNPPYIAAADPHLQQGDLRFEPRMALAAGADGLDDLRHIIDGAPAWLEPGGWLLLEHGYDQGEAVRTLLTAAGFAQVFTQKDLAGQDRVSGGRWDAPA